MYNNPYFKSGYQMGTPLQTPYFQTMQPVQTNNTQVGLLGKMVDSLEVVKSMDIPLDGSVSYFPLTNGSAIVSKQLQNDGTSKVVVYRPVEEKEKEDKAQFLTFDDLEDIVNDIQDLKDMKEDLKDVKKQIKEIKKCKDD